ncbi:MAG TPA: DUF4405 domain-containing protein [Candidatus Binatia bacterium]|nr:DUF4405 domain-containing protein [Candidatus Binatia bacterium]
MMVMWSLVTVSGFLLWVAPSGPRSGYRLLFWGLTKREWGDLHLWFSLIALGVTLLHIVIDWRGLCGCLRYLATVHRSDKLEELAKMAGKKTFSL